MQSIHFLFVYKFTILNAQLLLFPSPPLTLSIYLIAASSFLLLPPPFFFSSWFNQVLTAGWQTEEYLAASVPSHCLGLPGSEKHAVEIKKKGCDGYKHKRAVYFIQNVFFIEARDLRNCQRRKKESCSKVQPMSRKGDCPFSFSL